MIYRLEIPDWRPKTLNAILANRWAGPKAKKAAAKFFGVYARVFDIPPATGKRRVSLTLRMAKGERCPDEDAYWKVTLDALVRCKLLKQDVPKWCTLGPVTFERTGRAGVVVTLEEVA